jgi:acyl-CoA synthetase (AMP-forming)/AMP-acid ligase II
MDFAVRTRDMGYLDEDGFLYIVDRKEDMIISGGYNIWPLEIENALAAHPDVTEVAAVGVPDEKWGESVFAVVVLEQGSAVTENELTDWARARVGPVKKPRRIVISGEPLPKSVVGKLLRRQVREKYWTPRGLSVFPHVNRQIYGLDRHINCGTPGIARPRPRLTRQA